MCSVWTPLKQPPLPSEVSTLSSDAKKVLEALREAYRRKLQDQQQRLQARNGGLPQHYRLSSHNHQISQQEDVAHEHIKPELPPQPSPPANPLCEREQIDGEEPPAHSSPATIPCCERREIETQYDNTAVRQTTQGLPSLHVHHQLPSDIHPEFTKTNNGDKKELHSKDVISNVLSDALSTCPLSFIKKTPCSDTNIANGSAVKSSSCASATNSSQNLKKGDKFGRQVYITAGDTHNNNTDLPQFDVNTDLAGTVSGGGGGTIDTRNITNLPLIDVDIHVGQRDTITRADDMTAVGVTASQGDLVSDEAQNVVQDTLCELGVGQRWRLEAEDDINNDELGNVGVTVGQRSLVDHHSLTELIKTPKINKYDLGVMVVNMGRRSALDVRAGKVCMNTYNHEQSVRQIMITDANKRAHESDFSLHDNVDKSCTVIGDSKDKVVLAAAVDSDVFVSKVNDRKTIQKDVKAGQNPDQLMMIPADLSTSSICRPFQPVERIDQSVGVMKESKQDQTSFEHHKSAQVIRNNVDHKTLTTSQNLTKEDDESMMMTPAAGSTSSSVCRLFYRMEETNLSYQSSSAVGKVPSGGCRVRRDDERLNGDRRTGKYSSSEGNSRKRKVSSSSFQTPFKDASKKHQGVQTKQISVKKMMEKESISSHSVKDSFPDVSKMTREDRMILEERLKNATEVVMTMMYKDRSSQLREISQIKNKRVDDGSDSIAICITHTLKPKEGSIAESTEGSSQGLHQCYVLFPLDCRDGHKHHWSRDVLLSLMENVIRKICFDAQELMHAIMTCYHVQPYEVCCKWQVLDPKVAAWLLDPDHPPITFSDVCNVIKRVDRKALQSDVKLTNLVKKDLKNLSTAMEVLYQQLKKQNLWDLFTSVETKLIPILAAMEVQGIGVNVTTLKDYGKRLRNKIDELEDKAHKAAGCTFQVSSHVQLRQVLFDQLKLDQKLQGQKLARTNVQNLKSTSEAVLVKLQDLHPLPKIVLEYRQLMKLNSTYVDGLLEFVSNGSLHTSWEQTSASTGRVQSASPNIQNIPKQAIVIEKDAKKDEGDRSSGCFTIFAREPYTSQQGWTFIAADFQSIELRLLAHMSGDPVLLKVFNNKHSQDVFVELASEWLGMKTCDVTTADREKTKRIVYSVIYGVGPEKLAETLSVSKDEAKTFMKSFLNKFKGVSSFSHGCISRCQRHNGAIRTIFNRVRLIPNINSSNFHARSYAERQAVNFVVQGSAADICKIAMIQVMHQLASMPHLKARLLVQIHDELLLEVPDQHVQEVKDILKTVMEATDTLCGPKVVLKVPLPVSLSEGKTWGHLAYSCHGIQ